jgi:predicted short-subunit dehydrogenase-like oxidoreductase (DUF2520 family)
MWRINLIGAGRVGQTLGYLLAHSGLCTVQAVVSRTKLSADEAIDFIGQGYYVAAVEELPPAELTLITTPDDAIVQISERLAHNSALRAGDLVIHCSGRYSANCLMAVKEQGCWVASLHPLCSIANPAQGVLAFNGMLCALEGDVLAVEALWSLFSAVGVLPFRIASHQKALYHAASVFAANYVVTLANQAHLCFQQAGVDDALIKPLINQLMQSSVDNLMQAESPAQALTGPLQRGDSATISAHLQALSPSLRACYVELARATLPMAPLSVAHELTALFNE